MAMQKLAQSQASPSQKVEVTYHTSASQQAQSGASTSTSYNAPPAQATQTSQPINNSGNQNI